MVVLLNLLSELVVIINNLVVNVQNYISVAQGVYLFYGR